MEQGIKKGKNVGVKNILLTLLERRFDSLPKWACTKVKKADTPTLEKWAQRIIDAETLRDVLVD